MEALRVRYREYKRLCSVAEAAYRSFMSWYYEHYDILDTTRYRCHSCKMFFALFPQHTIYKGRDFCSQLCKIDWGVSVGIMAPCDRCQNCADMIFFTNNGEKLFLCSAACYSELDPYETRQMKYTYCYEIPEPIVGEYVNGRDALAIMNSLLDK
jgi:hypothetical protein